MFKRNSRGSLLLEALLTVVILSTSLTLIIQALTLSQRAVVYSSDYTIALTLIENKMFDLMQKGVIAANLNLEEAFPHPYEKFHYALTTQLLAEGDQKTLNEIDLIVSWSSGKKNNQMKIKSYLFNETE